MYRIDNATSAGSLPTPAVVGPHPNSYFTGGNPGGGVPATIVTADWANAIQEELCYVVEQAGLTLSKTSRVQLLAAIKLIAQGNSASYAASTTAANTYTATMSPVPAAYTTGQVIFIKFSNKNTGAATINLNSLGAKSIKRLNGDALAADDIYDSMIAALAYDGTNFQLLNQNMATVISGLKTDILNNAYRYAASSSAANTYTATLSPAPTAYTTGESVFIKFTNASTTSAPTLNLNSLGAKTITLANGGTLASGAIAANMIGEFVYDGTNFQLLNPSSTTVINGDLHTCEGRLTLTSTVPVLVSDVAAATTLYFTPFKGNKIHLYDGSNWNMRTFTELSIAVPATTNTMYDVWIYDNAGTPALELLAWTNDTTRATALTWQDGVIVKTGAATRRYVGSFRTTGVSGQTECSTTKRYLYNYYNRVCRSMFAYDTTNTWDYSTASFRQANATATNQLDVVMGVAEDVISVQAFGLTANSTATARNVYTGIGIDSSTVNSAAIVMQATCTGSLGVVSSASYEGLMVGRHTIVWLEKGNGSDTQTWLGDNGGVMQAGIIGKLWN